MYPQCTPTPSTRWFTIRTIPSTSVSASRTYPPVRGSEANSSCPHDDDPPGGIPDDPVGVTRDDSVGVRPDENLDEDNRDVDERNARGWRSLVDEERDPFPESAIDQAMQDATQCIQWCSQFLSSSTTTSTSVLDRAADVFQQCRWLWRQNYYTWRLPCGNHLNVPDMLWVCQCFLHTCARPRVGVHVTEAYVERVWRQLARALQWWDADPAVAQQWETLEAEVMTIVALWCDRQSCPPELLRVDLNEHDISAMTIGIDVHQDMDNRAGTADWKEPQAAHAARPSIGPPPPNPTSTEHPPSSAKPSITKALATVSIPTEAPMVSSQKGATYRDPTHWVRRGGRLSFFGGWQAALALMTPPAPLPTLSVSRSPVLDVTRSVHGGSWSEWRRRWDAHIQELRGQYIDDSVFFLAGRLIHTGVLSLGAIEDYMRLMKVDWGKVGPATVCRHDELRRIEDLAEAYRLAQTSHTDLWAKTPDQTSKLLRQESTEVASTLSHRGSTEVASTLPHRGSTEVASAGWTTQLCRESWVLALWHAEMSSLYDMDWMAQFLVPAHELRQRMAVYGESTRHGRPRLPVVLRCNAAWWVNAVAATYVFDTLDDALVLWCFLVKRDHQMRTETGIDMSSTLARIL